ncbi:MAG TPA: CPBP family intramembrane glutamic endopeptidase [Candidatus Eisenbacteria bacterium]
MPPLEPAPAEPGPPEDAPPEPFAPEPAAGLAPTPEPPPAFTPAPAPGGNDAARRAWRGLLVWLVALVVAGVGVLIGQAEAAALILLGVLFAGAQAADADPSWRQLWALFALVPPLAGAATFAYLVAMLLTGDLPPAQRTIGAAFALAGALALGLSALPRIARAIARRMFRTSSPSYAEILGAQVALAGLLLSVPAWFAFESIADSLLENPAPLLEKSRLSGALLGYALVALGGVGCWVRRDLRQSLDRLGLHPIRKRHLGIIAIGAVALFVLNGGGEAIQHRFFPALWASDREMTKMLARAMTPGRIALLSLSAGVGEEVTLRGGLQPRLGLLPTSLLFAALHVQYSWFGMLLVFTLGLTLGVVRQRASTTAAIVVHALYDMLALISS